MLHSGHLGARFQNKYMPTLTALVVTWFGKKKIKSNVSFLNMQINSHLCFLKCHLPFISLKKKKRIHRKVKEGPGKYEPSRIVRKLSQFGGKFSHVAPQLRPVQDSPLPRLPPLPAPLPLAPARPPQTPRSPHQATGRPCPDGARAASPLHPCLCACCPLCLENTSCPVCLTI